MEFSSQVGSRLVLNIESRTSKIVESVPQIDSKVAMQGSKWFKYTSWVEGALNFARVTFDIGTREKDGEGGAWESSGWDGENSSLTRDQD